MRFREEVLNVTLAQLLGGFGFVANPEIIQSGKLPDVRVNIGGLKLIFEGKNERAKRDLERQAKERLDNGLADISIALFYPDSLFEAASLDELRSNLSGSTYSGVMYYWSTAGSDTIALDHKSVNELAEILNYVVSLYIKNDLLSSKIRQIDEAIGKLAGEGQQTSLHFHGEAIERKLRKVLGIGEEPGEEGEG